MLLLASPSLAVRAQWTRCYGNYLGTHSSCSLGTEYLVKGGGAWLLALDLELSGYGTLQGELKGGGGEREREREDVHRDDLQVTSFGRLYFGTLAGGKEGI